MRSVDDTRKRVVWFKGVERWRDSRLTARKFASEIGVEHMALSRWAERRAGNQVVVYYLENGEPRMRAVHSADPAAAGEYWQVLRLPRSDAVQLGKDALACPKRHQQ